MEYKIIENELLTKINNIEDKKSNEYINIIYELSKFYYEMKKFEKSIFYLKKVNKLTETKNNVNFYLALNNLYLYKENEAKNFLKKELKINPQNNKAKSLLDKLEINSNFPYITILIFLLSFILMSIHFNILEFSFTNMLKYSLNPFNDSFFSLFISIFYHINFFHFLTNGIFFLIFGLYLEKYIGSFKFFLIFIFSGLIGNLSQYIIFPESFVMGLSSSVFGLLGAILMREPFFKMKVFGLINVPIIYIFGIFFVLETLITKYITLEIITIAQISHLFGFMSGILIMGFLYKDTIDVFYNWILISFSFFGITYSLTELIIKKFKLFDFILGIVIIFLAIILITYSYVKLKFLIMNKMRIENE